MRCECKLLVMRITVTTTTITCNSFRHHAQDSGCDSTWMNTSPLCFTIFAEHIAVSALEMIWSSPRTRFSENEDFDIFAVCLAKNVTLRIWRHMHVWKRMACESWCHMSVHCTSVDCTIHTFELRAKMCGSFVTQTNYCFSFTGRFPCSHYTFVKTYVHVHSANLHHRWDRMNLTMCFGWRMWGKRDGISMAYLTFTMLINEFHACTERRYRRICLAATPCNRINIMFNEFTIQLACFRGRNAQTACQRVRNHHSTHKSKWFLHYLN